jgi:hypothetical protein
MSVQPASKVFDILCAALLLHLHERFPKKIHVEFTDLDLAQRLEPLEAAEIWEWMDIFADTVSWLEEEGFIRSNGGTDDRDFLDVRLTMKGLAVLNAVPSSVQPAPQSRIERLKTAIGAGGKVASEEGLRLAMGAIFAAATSLGSS